ncbi:MAG: hypothetical protein H6558_12685 [Lewinellaceae bacterium]|nr:hypothetical protein [Lewinellaceae bacterium]MCB9288788.1 hypothetical protein [Lewinellaceae bacterium]
MEAAYQDIIDWLAKLNPEEVIAYSPSKETLERVQKLLLKQSADTLSTEEKEELQYYVYLENLLGLAKARAHQLLRA